MRSHSHFDGIDTPPTGLGSAKRRPKIPKASEEAALPSVATAPWLAGGG